MSERYEARVDMGSEGEGVMIFERSSAQVLLDGLRQMSAQDRREWIDERTQEALEVRFGIRFEE